MARSVAVNLGFTHYVLDYEDLFRTRVAEPFIEAYLAGNTPYPCAVCNADLKFGRLYQQAREIGAQYIATGHYVERRDLEDGGIAVGVPPIAEKDQTYALWAISPEVIRHALFPLGGLSKIEVRRHAERLGFTTISQSVESQDLCFVGGCGSLPRLSARARWCHTGQSGWSDSRSRRPAGSVSTGGWRITPWGQRKGLGINSGDPNAEPLYVVALEPDANALRVGPAGGFDGINRRGPVWSTG